MVIWVAFFQEGEVVPLYSLSRIVAQPSISLFLPDQGSTQLVFQASLTTQPKL
jgi:hypothetical protein